MLARNRDQRILPKHQLLLIALESKHKLLNRSLWAQLSAVCVLPSYTWMDELVNEALLLQSDHMPSCKVLDGVSATAVFASYSEHVNYTTQAIPSTRWASA
eukprot:6079767-Pleurochrysis_carterae.AAC.1